MTNQPKKSLAARFTFWARTFRSAMLFRALEQYCRGDVLDVGGRDFYKTISERKNIRFDTWTTLDVSKEEVAPLNPLHDRRFCAVEGDGCRMTFPDNHFDTVLNVQVLEHVFEPMNMIREIARVLKPGGHAVFLIPQTSVLHEIPHCYYNFTLFWIREAMLRVGLTIVDLKPLGGFWSSVASHLVHFFLKCARTPGMTPDDCKRNFWFYAFLPFMAVYAFLSIPICLFFSLGDLHEEPNNHLVVVRKDKR